jgi:GNAT superfamily N-acetyltransferase
MTTTIPMAAPAIPGLRFRHFREEDLPGMLRVYSAAHAADGIEEVTTLEQLWLNYENVVNCDPDRDITMAEVDGELVAYARVFWQELVDGGRSYETFGFVHPEWRRRGIGGALLRHNESLLRPPDRGHRPIGPWASRPSRRSSPGASRWSATARHSPIPSRVGMPTMISAAVARAPGASPVELRHRHASPPGNLIRVRPFQPG